MYIYIYIPRLIIDEYLFLILRRTVQHRKLTHCKSKVHNSSLMKMVMSPVKLYHAYHNNYIYIYYAYHHPRSDPGLGSHFDLQGEEKQLPARVHNDHQLFMALHMREAM